MKNSYLSPSIEVVQIEIESAILNDSLVSSSNLNVPSFGSQESAW